MTIYVRASKCTILKSEIVAILEEDDTLNTILYLGAGVTVTLEVGYKEFLKLYYNTDESVRIPNAGGD